MTFDNFITKYNGKFIDFDGYYGYQCVDLARQYIKDVLGYAPYTAMPSAANAKTIFNNFKSNQNPF